MFGRQRSEVLVVGAGPVGLFAAAALELRGVHADVVDARWEAAGHSYAVALHPHTLGLLDDLGLANPLIESGHRVDRLVFCDQYAARLRVDLAKISATFPFILLVNQGALETVLVEYLRTHRRHVSWNHCVSSLATEPNGVLVQVDRLDHASAGYGISSTQWAIDRSEDRTYAYVFGADGNQSLVRRSLGILDETFGEPETHAVFEFEGRSERSRELRIVINDDRVSVLWPLSEGRWRWMFQLDASDEAEHLLQRQAGRFAEGRHQLPREMLLQLIAERAPWFSSDVGELEWSTLIRFQRRCAATFAERHCVLLGDAAHRAGPAGVHSLNIGLREAHDAAALVAGILQGHVRPGHMRSYERSRRGEWSTLLHLAGAFTPSTTAPGWTLDNSEALLACLPAAGPDFPALAGQLGFVPTVKPMAAE
jgi:2-polyprenyl-6-methoxyphenol hydroxylase-like FAD-dependent oxidoreductase